MENLHKNNPEFKIEQKLKKILKYRRFVDQQLVFKHKENFNERHINKATNLEYRRFQRFLCIESLIFI